MKQPDFNKEKGTIPCLPSINENGDTASDIEASAAKNGTPARPFYPNAVRFSFDLLVLHDCKSSHDAQS